MNFSSPYTRDYRTTPRTPGWLARTFPAVLFYSRAWDIVWQASKLARHGRYDDQAWLGSALRTMHAIEDLGGMVTVENVAAYADLNGPSVIIANHMSTFETFALPAIVLPYRRVTFVVKRQLVEMPVFKHVMRSRQPIVVGRANPRDDLRTVLEEGEARLRAGSSVVVFPQKTRAASFTPAECNSIGVKLARRAGVPVSPLALRTDAWGLGRLVKDMGPVCPHKPVRFAFGPALTVSGNGREAHEAAVAFIAATLRAWSVPVLDRAPEAEPD